MSFSLPFEAFKGFCGRYRRATDFILKIYSLSEIQAFQRLRENRRQFEKFKFLAKSLFLHLFAAPTQTMNREDWLRARVEHAGEFFERKRLRTCPSLKSISTVYLTDVKVNRRAFESFW